MAKVTNHAKVGITVGLAKTRITLAPGQTADIQDWSECRKNKAVAGMLKDGILSDSKTKRQPDVTQEEETESAETQSE